MVKTELDCDESLRISSREWISACEALSELKRVVGFKAASVDILITAVAEGDLIATALRTREEWNIDRLRSNRQVTDPLVLLATDGAPLARITLDPSLFVRSGKTSLRKNWKRSAFVFIGPPGKAGPAPGDNGYVQAAGKRFMMLGVGFSRQQFVTLLKTYSSSSRRMSTAVRTGEKRSYTSKEGWEIRLKTYYDFAWNGELLPHTGIDKGGAVAGFARILMVSIGIDRNDNKQLQTFRRQAEKLLELNGKYGGGSGQTVQISHPEI